MTVSRAFRDDSLLAPETRENVLDAAAQLGYRPNALASALRSGWGPRTFGLVVPDLTTPSTWRLALGVQAAGQVHDAVVVVASGEEHAPDLIHDLAARQVDGCVVVPGRHDSAVLRRAAKRMPLVLVDRPTGGQGSDAVRGDELAGGRRAVDHLLALGHRQLHVLGDDSSAVARGRLDGVTDRAAELDLDVLLDDGKALVDGRDDDPGVGTAVLALDHRATVAALLVARDAEAPLHVVAFDYLDFAGALDVPLTVVGVDPLAVAAHAVALLHARLADPHQPPREVVLPHELSHHGPAPLRSTA